MEALFIYLLKSSGLIAMFYLAYHFLVRKETFFNSSRWFLITGLFTSLLLPLFSIKKIIYVERPKIALEDLIAYSKATSTTVKEIPAVEAFDWIQFIWVSYVLIACVLLIKIALNLLSLYRMLYKQQVVKKETFALVDINENIAPFSFFNYIVYNSNLYSNEELQSILLHEKIHSQEKHSMDVLIAKLFCIAFWFNPFVWLYKKAITQNLEYIADQKAIQQLEDKKTYQKALLKVVSNQSCLSITNNFYQSLIKKRIVMLNTNQSHKRNSWKYALVIPALIGLVLLFQIKTIAQEKESTTFSRHSQRDEVRVVTNKNSTDEEMKKDAAILKEKYGITLKFSKVKRNAAGEITGIKVEFKDKKGNKGVSQVNSDKPIEPIHFYKTDEAIGFGTPRNSGNERVYSFSGNGASAGDSYAYSYDDSIPDMRFDIDIEAPESPEAPEAPESPELAELAEMPEMAAIAGGGENSKIIIKKGGKKPVVIINGKVTEGSDLTAKEKEELENSIKMNDDGEDTQIIINGKDMAKIRSEAMTNAQIQIRKMGPKMKMQIKKNMERARRDMERARPEMERAREDMERNRPEMEQAKAEMEQAKAALEQAKAEMEQAKAALEQARAELKKKK